MMCMQNDHFLEHVNEIVNISEISAVFAYKLNLFSDGLQDLTTCKFKIFESAYDFGISGLQTVIFDIMQLRRG